MFSGYGTAVLSYQHISTPVPSTDKVCSALRYRNIDLLVTDMNTVDAFHARCQRQILYVCWWALVSNAEVLHRSGLSTIGDILRHRRVSLFGHVACLDSGVSAHDALRLMVNTYDGRKLMASWRRPPGCPLNVWLNKVLEDANALLLSTLWRSEIARGHGVAHRSLGVRDDDDDDDERCKTCVRNRG